jgi:predicted pyridoxine 5'-phosphate oxidase superfamily flavin-nucleotide-binding protein
MDGSPFHPGELEAQARAGGGSPGAGIRDFMPDQHRTFFGLLPFFPIAATDEKGWPVATILAGPPGFVSSPDPRTLRIEARPDPSDPAGSSLVPGASVGILGIDLGTRRRNRANGTIVSSDGKGFVVSVRQSFGNCPQYIRIRDHRQGLTSSGKVEHLPTLDQVARDQIGSADTFFVASSSGPKAGIVGGVDVSHRGGQPGFVRIDGDALTIPDFRGNRYFNTLGNLLIEPRAALLFVDFASGDILHIQGRVEIVWEGDEVRRFDDAERLWRVHVVRGWRRRGALPLRWTPRLDE